MHQAGPVPCAASAFSAMVPSPSRHLAALVRFDGLAHRPGDLGSILQEACRSAAEGVDAGYAGMLQDRVDEQAFVLQAGVGLPSRLVGRARVAADLGTPAGLGWQVNQPVHVRRFPAGGRIRALEAERCRAVRDATRAGHVVVPDAAERRRGRASGLQQGMQIAAGSD